VLHALYVKTTKRDRGAAVTYLVVASSGVKDVLRHPIRVEAKDVAVAGSALASV